MDFELNDIQKSVQQTFKDFVDKRVIPQAAAIDENAEFPMELFKEVGELGFFGMRYPEDVGGTNLDVVSYCAAVIELARGSMSLAAVATMQSLMATYFLYRFGDDEVRSHFDAAMRGEEIGGICMTEPNAGSDLFAIKTKAQVKENYFLLSGQKTWVTSAPVADFFTVLSKTDNHEKLSIFFVPVSLEGVEVGKKIDKLGACGSVTSEVSFDNVKLPLTYTSKIKESTKTEHVKKVVKSVGLDHRVNNLSNQLSGGEKQRVAIARALVNDPDVIFADEPTGNLDSKSGAQVMEILDDLSNQGKTVILVTHEQYTAEYAERIIKLKDGKIVSDNHDHHRRREGLKK